MASRLASGLPPMIAAMPSNCLVQLVMGDAESRQPVIPVVMPTPPQEVAIRRRHSRVIPNAAVAALKLHDGVVPRVPEPWPRGPGPARPQQKLVSS